MDVEGLLPLQPSIRICKGIYPEPASIALQDRRAIQENYLRLAELVLHSKGFAAFATHDPWLIDRCLGQVKKRGTGPESHEFQMLLGVGESLRPAIRESGSSIRLYCPYGVDWYAYSVRRLRENPRMAGYVLKSLFRSAFWRSEKLRSA